jgi:multidrug efflux pump subunit AcrB
MADPLTRLAQRPKIAAICGAGVVIAGLLSLFGMPVEWVPTVELPAVNITAFWPGASPESVERYVTAPIERSLRGITGTTKVESYSAEGRVFLRLEVSSEVRLAFFLSEVSDRLAALRPSLPPFVVPHVTPEIPESLRERQGFLTLQLAGRSDPRRLRELAEQAVAPQLRRLPGIASVVAEGGEEQEILVSVRSEALSRYGVSSAAVTQDLAEALLSRSFGWLREQGGQALLFRPSLASLESIARLPVAGGPERGSPLRLSDIADVRLGAAPLRSISRVDGRPVVALILDRAPASDLLKTAVRVQSEIPRITASLPAGMRLLVAEDRSRDVRDELRLLQLQGGVGALLIGGVLWAMFRSLRAVLVIAFSVATSVAMALAVMRLSGLTLNLLTLGGLVTLAGILIDSSTVVLDRMIGSGGPPGAADRRERAERCVRAARSVLSPLLACTASASAVFLPMVYMSGDLRALFAAFAVAATTALWFSLASASILVPALGQFALARPGKTSALLLRARRHLERNALLLYRLAGRRPGWTLLLLGLAVGAPVHLLPDTLREPSAGWESARQEQIAETYNRTIGSRSVRNTRLWLDPLVGGATRMFFRNVQIGSTWNQQARPELVVTLQPPGGTPIEQADEQIKKFEKRALGSPAVESVLTRVVDDVAQLRIAFPKGSEAWEEPLALREALIGQAIQVAGMEVRVTGLTSIGFYSGLGEAAGFTIEAFGPSYLRLGEVIAEFATQLARDPRVAQVDVGADRFGQASSREVFELRWNPAATRQTGLTTVDVAERLSQRLFTWHPSFFCFFGSDPRMAVRVLTKSDKNYELPLLLQTVLSEGGGRDLRLAGLADLRRHPQPLAIERENQQYRTYLQIYYRGPYQMGRKLIDRQIRTQSLPPGYRLQRLKYSLVDDNFKQQIPWLGLAALGLIFLAIASALESWRLAGWAMVGLPLAWIGVALGFSWSGEDCSEGAFLGLFLIAGLAVNSGILLMDRFRSLSLAHPCNAPRTLILLAIRDRLRPLWATTLTSVLAMLPVLLMPESSPFWRELAVAVIGGLVSSCILGPLALVAMVSRRSSRIPRPVCIDLAQAKQVPANSKTQ